MKVHPLTLSRRHRKSQAFTLIEMILVLAIITLLLGAGVWKLTGVTESGKKTAVRGDLSAIVSALRLYEIEARRLPTQEQGLLALVERPTTAPQPRSWLQQVGTREKLIDPWGNMYQYRVPGMGSNEFDVYSLGSDGKDGTEDDVGMGD